MAFNETHHKWHSPSLNREVEMLVFGHAGQPVVLFPTSQGVYYQNKDQGLIDQAGWLLGKGKIKIYCPDTLDSFTWYNKSVAPGERAWNYNLYDRMLQTELIPWMQYETGYERIATAGCSFGGYHAVNTAFRHPELVSYCFSMSGAFDVRQFMEGYYDDNVYFNNPVDYAGSIGDPWQLAQLASCDLHLATGSGPFEHSGEAYRLSEILASRGIPHHLDDWGPLGGHDWPYWKHQMREYLSR